MLLPSLRFLFDQKKNNNFVVVIFQLDPRPGLCVSFIFSQKLTVGSLTGRHSPVILILNPITFPSPINRTHLDCWMVSNHGDRFTFFPWFFQHSDDLILILVVVTVVLVGAPPEACNRITFSRLPLYYFLYGFGVADVLAADSTQRFRLIALAAIFSPLKRHFDLETTPLARPDEDATYSLAGPNVRLLSIAT